MTPEQSAALVEALESKLPLELEESPPFFRLNRLCYTDGHLTDAGRIVAELCRRLEYAERPRSCYCECGAACTVKHGKRKD